MQAHYAARAHDEPAGYAAAFPYCGLVRPIFEELAAELAESGAACRTPPRRRPERAPAACGGQAAAGADDYALFDCI